MDILLGLGLDSSFQVLLERFQADADHVGKTRVHGFLQKKSQH